MHVRRSSWDRTLSLNRNVECWWWSKSLKVCFRASTGLCYGDLFVTFTIYKHVFFSKFNCSTNATAILFHYNYTKITIKNTTDEACFEQNRCFLWLELIVSGRFQQRWEYRAQGTLPSWQSSMQWVIVLNHLEKRVFICSSDFNKKKS